MVRVGILGASGYTGAELVRLLSSHPEAQIVLATSETYAGKKLNEVVPALGPAGELVLSSLEGAVLSPETVDAVFLALPHGESLNWVPRLMEAGVKVIDLSGDFRFQDTKVYEQWYQREHTGREWAAQAVYGLPELFRKEIPQARLLANPGCFVTSAVLALYPLVLARLVESRQLIVDSKTSPSGGGRKARLEYQFTQISENVVPYKLAGAHQHTPEMEIALSRATGEKVSITFSPQMVPARRGILTTAYGRLVRPMTTAELVRVYQEVYVQEPFVSVQDGRDQGWPALSSVVGTNGCRLGVAVDERTGMAVVVSVIDNLVKGASGQAVQNLNLMSGFEETAGLSRVGMAP